MTRPFAELIRDYEDDPTRWEVVRAETLPSTNRRNRGGTSVQELLRNKMTGEEIVRHTLRRANGSPFNPPHFRALWK